MKKNRINTVLCFVFEFLGCKFRVTQYRWGRKLYGGKWYLIYPRGLSMANFWSDIIITSCQSEIINMEDNENN